MTKRVDKFVQEYKQEFEKKEREKAKQNAQKLKLRKQYEEMAYKEDIRKAIEYIKEYESKYPKQEIDLEYFFNAAKLAVASEYLGNKEIARAYSELIKTHFLKKTFFFQVAKSSMQIQKQYVKCCCASLDILSRLGDFDSFCLAMEFNRKWQDQFYYPRRDVFIRLGIVQDLQDLADGKLDVLSISLPQRTGKSRLGLFFLTFMKMKNLHKERQTFGTGHSAGLMKSFYDEILMYLTDTQTYRVFEIFSGHNVIRQSAEYMFIDIDRNKGMPDIVFRSIDGSITGAVEGGDLMYVDDLIKDDNEVINTNIADNIWSAFNTLVLGRMKSGIPLLYLGTKWGVNCPISRLEAEYTPKNLKKLDLKLKCRFRSFSCYDANGESQFKYKYGVGFDTSYYKRLELTMKKSDPALWSAMYLGEAITRYGKPFEKLTFYTELPTRKPDYVACSIDVATMAGGDYWSMPMGLFYEKEKQVYIEDIVYSNAGTDKTIPKSVAMIMKYTPSHCEVEEKEATKGIIQTGIGAKMREYLYKMGYKINIHSHSASGQKAKKDRILAYRTSILGIPTKTDWTVHFNEHRYAHDLEYTKFVDCIINWSEEDSVQRKQEDDAPDSIAQLLRYCASGNQPKLHSNINLKDLGL